MPVLPQTLKEMEDFRISVNTEDEKLLTRLDQIRGSGKAAVNHLYGGDGSLLCGGDPLLHAAHVSGEGGLVTHSGGNTTQQGGHLRTSL